MTKKTLLAAGLVASIALSSTIARAADDDAAPIQLALWETVQIVDMNRSIHGFRLNVVYGTNRDLYGADIGFANRLTGDMRGFQWGGGGWVEGDLWGVQSHLVLSVAHGEVIGGQAAIFSWSGDLKGLQTGIFSYSEREAIGARLSGVNWSAGSTTGFELGIVNYTPAMSGLQLGIVNVTDRLDGVQIGIVNVAHNGFLPVFVIFNFAFD